MELFPFQFNASTQIADRFAEYMQEPLTVTRNEVVPFYQNLYSITGSGKTVILADAVEQIRTRLSLEPIVLWLSKGRVVVLQTLQNLDAGKYAPLIGGYTVKPLLDCKPTDIEDSNQGLILVATTGKFNQKDQEGGDRKIFRVGLDLSATSLWDALKLRKDTTGKKRNLIVVYDEGHNLTNQQTEMLMSLKPDALIAASATSKVPETLSKVIQRLRNDKNWTDADLVTQVKSSDVVASGLVKKHVMLGGYVTPMELAVNELISDFRKAEKTADDLLLRWKPKAIYVSDTNTVDDSSIAEDVARPFNERQARPILIWNHLVNNCGVDPSEIAVYCNLKFDKKTPPPKGFVLFSGGDSDYDRFIQGNYRHIIFNQTLQEGWDDPECSFAYIDKGMGSPDQVTQVVGRVLRQPGAQHYPPAILNTAHFYIRTDEKGVFDAIIGDVRNKLTTENPDVTVAIRKTDRSSSRSLADVKREKSVPLASVDSSNAKEPISQIVSKILDFSTDHAGNTIGKGQRIQVLQTIGKAGEEIEEWVELEHSNRVTARWLFRRALARGYAKAENLCDIEQPRFDALIEYNSSAADHIRERANEVIEAYIEHSVVVQNSDDTPYTIAEVPYTDGDFVEYSNAVHEGYSGLNKFEKAFADALDKTKRVWCRNPSQGAFSIPLLDRRGTKKFFPDFLVWVDKNIVAIDTKGDHLIAEDSARKLFHIEQIGEGAALTIRLVTEGKWLSKEIKESGSSGYTIWSLKNGKLHTEHCENIVKAAQACLK
jgi:type III restriction enzyme